jgi:hypothetical protein
MHFVFIPYLAGFVGIGRRANFSSPDLSVRNDSSAANGVIVAAAAASFVCPTIRPFSHYAAVCADTRQRACPRDEIYVLPAFVTGVPDLT